MDLDHAGLGQQRPTDSDTLVAGECLTEEREYRWIDQEAIHLYYEQRERCLPANGR